MSYSVEEQIEDTVMPAINKFIVSEKNQEDLVAMINQIFEGDGIRNDRLKTIFINSMFSDEQRLGAKMKDIFHCITNYEMSLKKLVYTDNIDTITEDYDSIKEDE